MHALGRNLEPDGVMHRRKEREERDIGQAEGVSHEERAPLETLVPNSQHLEKAALCLVDLRLIALRLEKTSIAMAPASEPISCDTREASMRTSARSAALDGMSDGSG